MHEGMKHKMINKSMMLGWMMDQFSEEEKMELAIKKLEIKINMMENKLELLRMKRRMLKDKM
ncbi:hypothetical protein [Methanobacterium sp. ACI-7]|uniref:hypothetical protein n=1 Tax=unclassified Methanobacterium TaxID=2627676 RepID=UPI0039C227F9